MLTDNSLDIDQFLNTDLFTHTSPASLSSSPSSPEQSLLTPPQPSPPHSFQDTPNDNLTSAFALFDDDLKVVDPLNPSPFDYLGVSSSSLDHPLSGYPMDLGYGSMSGMAGLSMNMGIGMGLNMPIAPDSLHQMAIDPQLVGTPASTAPITDFDDDEGAQEGDDENSNTSAVTSPAAAPLPSSPNSTSPPTVEKDGEREKLTLTIAPIKVGGHGKARRGTVQSGGVVKKTATSFLHRDKENILSSTSLPSSAHNAALSTPLSSTSPSTPASSQSATTKGLPKPPAILKAATAKKGKAKDEIDDEDDDDVPQDWRPSPEVFAKMTSKEKRQLRNKISARNFRVRRKGSLFTIYVHFRPTTNEKKKIEYISTLEGDIAERDRLLEAIRSELGSTQSENLALRQEIASLKKVLLEGRGSADLPSLNLPPPAPLPLGLGAPTAATSSSSTTITTETMVPSPPTTPIPHQQVNATASTINPTFALNTQKDLPSSPMPRNSGGFWGGQHQSITMGGGITPVHTALVPEINVGLWNGGFGNKKVLGDSGGMNMNPLLNLIGAGVTGVGAERKKDSSLLLKEEEKEKEREEKNMSTATGLTGFDAFADANLFTMKSLDAYVFFLFSLLYIFTNTYTKQLPYAIVGQNGSTASRSSTSPCSTTTTIPTPTTTSAQSIFWSYRSRIRTSSSILFFTKGVIIIIIIIDDEYEWFGEYIIHFTFRQTFYFVWIGYTTDFT